MTPLNHRLLAIGDLHQDILSTAHKIRAAAVMCIPSKRMKSSKPGKIHNRELSHLCRKSRCALRKWKKAGRLRSGLLYDERRKFKRDVQCYLNLQRGNLER